MRLAHVIGTRPNIVKCAPVMRALSKYDQVLIHTRQHFSPEMSDSIAQDVGLPVPDFLLSGQDSIEEIATAIRLSEPDLVFVYGDCRSTLQGAMAARMTGKKLAHVEAGLRCGDLSMEEEKIRIYVDSVSDLLFAPSEDAVRNLALEREVIGEIHLVGNVMADSLFRVISHPTKMWLGNFVLLTLHRPFNVDDLDALSRIHCEVQKIGLPVAFPAHPRIQAEIPGAQPPFPYRMFVSCLHSAALVVTDSGGVQEEATLLGTPCLTVRPSTERPITVTHGTNRLVAIHQIVPAAKDILSREKKPAPKIPLWDGRASERIAKVIDEYAAR